MTTTTPNLGLSIEDDNSFYEDWVSSQNANWAAVDQLYGDLLDTLDEVDQIYADVLDIEESEEVET